MFKMFLNTFIFLISVLFLNSCISNSFKLSSIGRYYKCTKAEDIELRKIKRIGVFAIGTECTKKKEPLSQFYDSYPTNVDLNSALLGSKLNSEIEKVIISKATDSLLKRGYDALPISDLYVIDTLFVRDIAIFARDKGYNAVFIINYTILTKHNYSEINSKNKNYLILSSSALLSCEDGTTLWSNQYYGIVQQSHFFNLIGSSYAVLIPESVLDYSAVTIEDAADKALEMIFTPKYFYKNTIHFPIISSKL